jgi:glycosyltransferase involved in cell wall biosynthesis
MFNIVRKNLQAATRIASTSKIMREQILKLYQPSHEIFVTPFGVDLDVFKPSRKQDSRYITIGIIKTIDEKYGQTYLIRAFKLLLDRLKSESQTEIANRLRLIIIGDGPQKVVVQSLVTQLGLDGQVSIIGRVKNADVPYYLNQFDIACFPSTLESESFGVAVIEASACEIPVIASNIGGLTEVVIDGETGYLVQPCDELALAEKIYHLIRYPELRQKMGRQGRQFVIKKYDWQENLGRMAYYMEKTIVEYNSEVKKHKIR